MLAIENYRGLKNDLTFMKRGIKLYLKHILLVSRPFVSISLRPRGLNHATPHVKNSVNGKTYSVHRLGSSV